MIFLVGMFGTCFARWMLDDVYLGVGQDHLEFVTICRDERVGSVSFILKPYRDGRFELC